MTSDGIAMFYGDTVLMTNEDSLVLWTLSDDRDHKLSSVLHSGNVLSLAWDGNVAVILDAKGMLHTFSVVRKKSLPRQLAFESASLFLDLNPLHQRSCKLHHHYSGFICVGHVDSIWQDVQEEPTHCTLSLHFLVLRNVDDKLTLSLLHSSKMSVDSAPSAFSQLQLVAQDAVIFSLKKGSKQNPSNGVGFYHVERGLTLFKESFEGVAATPFLEPHSWVSCSSSEPRLFRFVHTQKVSHRFNRRLVGRRIYDVFPRRFGSLVFLLVDANVVLFDVQSMTEVYRLQETIQSTRQPALLRISECGNVVLWREASDDYIKVWDYTPLWGDILSLYPFSEKISKAQHPFQAFKQL